jgi:N-acetylmuramic acid 6-phosphate (MurNAc-6-P) etherase
MRFINLKNENKKLKQRKIDINQEMEDIQTKERETLGKMKKELYEK